ncbi:hypothetical protein KR026_008014 [Drosophila bipectinata]|nr:hypothetical protein KR026_008014 [Drosophila bipectinata]
MASGSTKSNDIEKLVQQSNCLLPDLSIRQSDLSHPSEAILTRIFIQYLKAFGFRVEPPHKVDCEVFDPSREKRLFLIRLCRQVERILQISFPNKTYTYVDIINPAGKKTLNTLEFLLNYLAYYKLFKKSVLGPAEEAVKKRESLYAEFTAKSSELEQRKQKASTIKSEMEVCQTHIEQLKKDLVQGQTELAQKKKPLGDLTNDVELLEQQHGELNKRISHLEQQVVGENQVMDLKKQIQGINSHIESCKMELANKEKVFNDQRQQIESSQEMVAEIEKAVTILPSNVIEDYKKSCKQLEAIEKELAQVKIQEQKSVYEVTEKQQEIQETDKQFQSRKKLLDEQDNKTQKQIEERKAKIDDLEKILEKQEKKNQDLEVEIDNEDQIHAALEDNICQALGDDWHSPEDV